MYTCKKIWILLGICVIFMFCTIENLAGQISIIGGGSAHRIAQTELIFTSTSNSYIGYMAGIEYESPISPTTQLKYGGYFTKKGGTYDLGGKAVLDYVNFHFSFTYLPYKEPTVYADFGIFMGYLVGARSLTNSIDQLFNKLDGGIFGGIGYNFGSVRIGLTGSFGLIDITKNFTENIRNTLQGGCLYIGYRFS